MEPFLKLVAQDIKSKFGNDLSDIAIVFNNQRPVTYLKKHLADIYKHAIWSPQFFTIQSFLKKSTAKAEASELSQFFDLYTIHNELLAEEGSATETLEDFYPIAEIILHDFGQIDYELASVNHIFSELYDMTKIDVEFQHFTEEQQEYIRQFWRSFSKDDERFLQKRFLKLWRRLPKLYHEFKKRLREENRTNFPTIYRDLAEGNADHPNFINKFKKVLFVGFNALNQVESNLFAQWQDEEKALFYFDTDSYYLDDQMQEAGFFLRKDIKNFGLKNALEECPSIIENRQDTVNIYAATGKESEAKLLSKILSESEQNIAAKSSAILLADESLLVPLLQSVTGRESKHHDWIPSDTVTYLWIARSLARGTRNHILPKKLEVAL